MVSVEIAVAVAVLIENLADFEVRDNCRFLQADENLDYLTEEQSLERNCSVT